MSNESKFNEAAPGTTKNYRVLIVDDKPEMRLALSNLLYFEKNLTVVGTAEDGAEAVKKAQEVEPDVILMDIEMPVMDGIAATRQIKRDRPATIVIAISSEMRHKSAALQAGAVAFFTKPLSTEDFIAAIQHE
jgi:CheY-like chemotaxis protein